MKKKYLSYADFSNAWSTWTEFYNEKNSCPYAQANDCPEPCPVDYPTRLDEARRLWVVWWDTLPEEHWLKAYKV